MIVRSDSVFQEILHILVWEYEGQVILHSDCWHSRRNHSAERVDWHEFLTWLQTFFVFWKKWNLKMNMGEWVIIHIFFCKLFLSQKWICICSLQSHRSCFEYSEMIFNETQAIDLPLCLGILEYKIWKKWKKGRGRRKRCKFNVKKKNWLAWTQTVFYSWQWLSHDSDSIWCTSPYKQKMYSPTSYFWHIFLTERHK